MGERANQNQKQVSREKMRKEETSVLRERNKKRDRGAADRMIETKKEKTERHGRER